MVTRERSLARRLVASLGLQVVGVLALAMVVIALRADAGARPAFSVSVEGATVIGGVDVSLSAEGPLMTNAGSGPCAGGEIDSGSLEVGDGKTSMSGVLTYGLATAGCVPGFAGGVYVEARGYWETPSTQAFTITMIARRSGEGSLAAVVGDIATSLGYRSRESMGAPEFFTGRFRGAGESSGLQGTGGVAQDTTIVDRLRAELPPMRTHDGAQTLPGSARTGSRFRLDATSGLLLGSGEVQVKVSGFVNGGGKGCANAGVASGTVAIVDADDRFVASVREGYVSTCNGKSTENGHSIRIVLSGAMRDAEDTPASFAFNGTIDAKGKITLGSGLVSVVRSEGSIGKGASAGSVLDEVARLRANVVTYFGGTANGGGTAVNLVPPDRPDPRPNVRRFALSVSGADGATVALSSEGSFYPDYPDSRNVVLAGKITVTVDGRAYEVQLNRFVFTRDEPHAAQIQVLGVLRAPKDDAARPEAPAGFLIAELSVPHVPSGLFAHGGKASIEGRIAALRVGTKTYRPTVLGTLTIDVGAQQGAN